MLQIFGLLEIFFVILESQAAIGEASSNFSVQSEMNHIYFLLPNDQYRHCCCCLVAKLCPTLCNPMDWGRQDFPALHYLPEFAQTHVHWVGDAIQPSHPQLPLLLLSSILPSIGVFSNESALLIRWPKFCSFIFSISPSNDCSGLISFRIDWFDLLAV